MTKKEFGSYLIDSLEREPEKWVFDGYTARRGSVEIWIANRPHADLKLYFPMARRGHTRVCAFWQRRRLRRAIDNAALTNAANRIANDH